MLVCAPLTFEARAAASSEDGRSSAVAANAGDAAGRAAPRRNAGTKPGRPGDRGSNQASARTSDGSKGRDAAVVPQAARSNADRLHALLNAQARGPLARQPGRGVGSTRAVTHGPDDARGRQGVSAAGQPKLAASTNAAAMP